MPFDVAEPGCAKVAALAEDWAGMTVDARRVDVPVEAVPGIAVGAAFVEKPVESRLVGRPLDRALVGRLVEPLLETTPVPEAVSVGKEPSVVVETERGKEVDLGSITVGVKVEVGTTSLEENVWVWVG